MSGIGEPYHRGSSVKLTDDEKSKFDNITYDEIYSMRDMKQLYKLEKYMREEGFPTTADTVKMRIIELGGRTEESLQAEAQEELKKFRDELSSWESEMEKTQKILKEEKLVQGRHGDGRPPVRRHGVNKENAKQQENKPLSKEEAATLKSKEKGDLRSGESYYDKWSRYTEVELKEIEEEEKTEAEIAAKKLKGELKGSAEDEAADDGGTGLHKVYSAMSKMSTAEKLWQSQREKEKGNEMFKAKEYAGSINAYSLSLKLQPGVAAVHTNRAAAYLKLKRWEDAMHDCTWALEIEPKNFKALLRRGAALLEMDEDGSIEKAVADIEAALEQEPENQELIKLHETALRKVRQFIDKQDSRRMNRLKIQEVDEDESDEEEEEETESYIPARESKQVMIEEIDSEEEEEEEEEEVEEVRGDSTTASTECSVDPSLEQSKGTRSGTQILIEEDDSEEEEEEENMDAQEVAVEPIATEKGDKSTPSNSEATASSTAERDHDGLPPPKNSVEFERACKTIAHDPEVLGRYIKAIEPESYSKLFKDSINATMLSAMVRALSSFYIPNGEAAAALHSLDALSKVPRFSMVVMLMSRTDKDLLRSVFEAIESAGLQAATVRKLYRV